MTEASAWLLVDLARRGARNRAGTLRFEGAGLPGGRGDVTGSGDPVATVVVHDARAWSTVLRHGSLGLAESYIAGWWDTDDLTSVVRIAYRRTTGPRRFLDASARRAGPLLSGLKRLRAPSKHTDRENIAAHYDLSNEFFALMLDPTMAYSCAYFDTDAVTLEEAQVAKFDMIATKLDLRPEDHLVEIGTGWGGFAVHAARHYGCRVTTTTISEAQRSLAEKRVAEHGLADRVSVLGADYRDLGGRYDALVSVEMVEAVDWRRHDQFFATCARLLTDRGRMGLQAITIADGSFERARSCTTSSSAPWCSRAAFSPPSPPSAPRWHAPRICGSSTSRTSARTMPRRCAAGGPTWSVSVLPSSASVSTTVSGGSGRSISATAKRPSANDTSPTSR